MELLPNNIVQKDTWNAIPNGEDVPSYIEKPTIAPFSDALIPLLGNNHTNLGVLLQNDQDVYLLKNYIKRLPLIALVFPKFNDGRAFSQARTLRSTFGFQGTLRATGDILPPQVSFMRRCGFDSIIINTDRFPQSVWFDSLSAFSAVYQKEEAHNTSGDDIPVSIIQQRKK